MSNTETKFVAIDNNGRYVVAIGLKTSDVTMAHRFTAEEIGRFLRRAYAWDCKAVKVTS